jgi:hypothetical protein
MTIRQEQFVVDKEGNRIGVVLDIEDYQKLLADVEELESIRAFDEVKASAKKPIPFERAVALRTAQTSSGPSHICCR